MVFIKEIVPKWALTFVANTVYKEHYETLPMKHTWNVESDQLTVEYQWKKNNKWNSIRVDAHNEKRKIEENSETEFITEHYWGYAKVTEQKTNEYEVTHPKWDVYEVSDYSIDVDYGTVYGEEFQFLNSMTPTSVMLAEGSEITVENKKTLR